MTLDDLRAAFPDLGFALYAIEPRGVVTLEVYADGAIFSYRGETAEAAIETAFPSPPERRPGSIRDLGAEMGMPPIVINDTPLLPANVFD